MNLSRVTAPTAEPLHLEHVKHALRIDTNDDDAFLPGLIAAARVTAEASRGESFVVGTWDFKMDDFPDDEIIIPRVPLISITSITYVDTSGETQTVATTVYTAQTGTKPGSVRLKYQQAWPVVRSQPNAVTVRFVAGYLTYISDVANTTDIITVDGRTLSNGDKVRLWNSGGSERSLPGGLAESTDYYVVSASGSTLKLSATSGGTEVDLESSGIGSHFLGYELLPETVVQGMLMFVTSEYEHCDESHKASSRLLNIDRTWVLK